MVQTITEQGRSVCMIAIGNDRSGLFDVMAPGLSRPGLSMEVFRHGSKLFLKLKLNIQE